MRRALVTGAAGQVGSYMCELLLSKGYEVHGLVRRTSSLARPRIDHLPQLHLHYGDMTDHLSLRAALEASEPGEVYNFAAQSHVQVSFESPAYTSATIYDGVRNLLTEVQQVCPNARVYQAGTSEMFGASPSPQNERTRFLPQSPYAVAKVAAHHLCHYYRDRGMFVANGIAFNHESPRRGENFVTRKIALGVAAIKRGEATTLPLGNLEARRDWGFAGDYVKGMWAALQHHSPDDFVFATGESASVRDFARLAFAHADLNWEDFVTQDPRYMRPSEVPDLCGDARHARNLLGWEPETHLPQLIAMMVDHDLGV